MWGKLSLPSDCTFVVSCLAAIGSLTGPRQRVPQGSDGRVLDPQRCTHQQQHRLPGALHPAPTSGSTSFTLKPWRQKDNEISFLRFFFPALYMYCFHAYRSLLMAFWAALAQGHLRKKRHVINFSHQRFSLRGQNVHLCPSTAAVLCHYRPEFNE